MRRSVVTMTVTLALALAPAAVFAQTPPAGQPPAVSRPQGSRRPHAAARRTKEPRMALTGPAGAFMFLIKPDQTANFEELIGKVKDALAKSENPVRKQQLAGWKVFKAAEPLGAERAVSGDDRSRSPGRRVRSSGHPCGEPRDQAGTPENQEMLKKYAGVFANVSRLNLTPDRQVSSAAKPPSARFKADRSHRTCRPRFHHPS